MFQWYSNAAVCYTYLCDVTGDIRSKLAKCRWVTRGWTLQELIAPCEVIFYSRDWRVLGTRSRFSGLLASVTRIDEPFLIKRRNLDQASIAQRMSWASRRTTSREEDMAYCLLGIFNINMPLIYGEGPKAFRRLQEAINREYPEDHSLFAWGKVVSRLSNLVDDDEQLVGSKPVKYESNQVGTQLVGLFAQGPHAFEHSGQFVLAPGATNYFQFGANMPSVSTLMGHTAYVEFPVIAFRGRAAFHLKHPPIGE
jgi:hypothetical protein